jgi:hypothetical protein
MSARKVSLVQMWRLQLIVVSDPELSRGEVATGMHLLDMVGKNGTAWPSYETLAQRTNQALRNVKRCIERPVTKGYFRVDRREGRGHSNAYRPALDRLKTVSPTSPFPDDETVSPASPFNGENGDADVTLSDAQTVSPASVNGVAGVQQTVSPVTPELA